MKKCIALVFTSILLNGCSAPQSNNIVKFYNTEEKEIQIKPKYVDARGGYNEYTCVDNEAIIIARSYADDTIKNARPIGTNCLEYDMKKLEAEKKLIKGPE